MEIILTLKDVGIEKPELHKEVLIFDKDLQSFEKAYYMIWNEGDGEDEYHAWKVQDDVDITFDACPLWCDPLPEEGWNNIK